MCVVQLLIGTLQPFGHVPERAIKTHTHTHSNVHIDTLKGWCGWPLDCLTDRQIHLHTHTDTHTRDENNTSLAVAAGNKSLSAFISGTIRVNYSSGLPLYLN